jgi:NAD(P)-dependent dehydrogenase (short-subunit alcohol dehydrogenase family)
MGGTLAGQRVLVIGGSKFIGEAIARAAGLAGAHVIIGARDIDAAKAVANTLPGGTAVRIDLTDEASIAAAATEIGAVDHIVSTASAPHNVPVAGLEHDALVRAFDAKVLGPLLVAKHFAPLMPPTGSLLLFSGVAAWKPQPGLTVMGVTNGAVEFLATHLARELAPIRVNAISPGIIDSGTWDKMGEDGKRGVLDRASAGNLAGRPGALADIAEAALWLLGAGFVTGEAIHVEGGARHAS